MGVLSNLKSRALTVLETRLGIRLRRGWFPRGESLAFDVRQLLAGLPTPAIVDVGANVGDTVLLWRREFPSSRIWAIEPTRQTFEILSARLGQLPRLSLHQIAIGGEPGKATLFHFPGSVNNSLNKPTSETEQDSETVDVIPLDAFCQREQVNEVALVKIDTEGYELEVIAGARGMIEQGRIAAIIIEAGFGIGNAKHVGFCDIYQQLTSLGMELYGIYDQRREFSGNRPLRRADCLYVNGLASLPSSKVDTPDV